MGPNWYFQLTHRHTQSFITSYLYLEVGEEIFLELCSLKMHLEDILGGPFELINSGDFE